MALLLNKGFIEFWFDCGSGVGSVRSRETILLNEWNSVVIYRHRWDAWLVLNHGSKVQGRSNGLFSRITFREPVFLGGTGNITGLAKRLPVYNGFVGCIRRFVANDHTYNFEEHPRGDVSKGFDIQDCSTDKCFKYPCQHGGKCLPSDEGATCLCPIGFVGDLCEIRMDLQVPAFNGSSFLRYAPLGESALIWLELKVILKPEQNDGIILYSGPKLAGDFIALALNGGYVEFIFDLGSGAAVVRSDGPLTIGQWHTIRVSRTARLAVLKIDSHPEVMTISSNGFWHLSLPENLFLGGVNHVDKLPGDLKVRPFFMGCIQRIDINGHSLAIVSEALGGTNIGNCPHACVARPCGPLAECVPQMESYECRCGAHNLQCNAAAGELVSLVEKQRANEQSHKVKQQSSSDAGNANEAKITPNMMLKMQRKHSNAKKSNKAHLTKEHGRYVIKKGLANRAASSSSSTTTTTTRASSSSTTTTTTTTTMPYEQDIEDDIIFRDVHAMHKKHAQRSHAAAAVAAELVPSFDIQAAKAEQYAAPKNKRMSYEPTPLPVKKQHHGKSHSHYGSKHDPYVKHSTIERKLSRLPTHYESFQTNPESDILTFEDNVELAASLSLHSSEADATLADDDYNYNEQQEQLQTDKNPTIVATANDYNVEGPVYVMPDETSKRPDAMQKQDSKPQASDNDFNAADNDDDDVDYNNDDTENKKQNDEQAAAAAKLADYMQQEQKSLDEIEAEPFVLDESIFDDDDADGSEEYHRKQLSQDMKRIMANTHARTTRRSKLDIAPTPAIMQVQPAKAFKSATNSNKPNDYYEYYTEEDDDALLQAVQGFSETMPPILPSLAPSISSRIPLLPQTAAPQTHTDWSLLKKFEVDNLPQFAIHKNFGACFVGVDSYFHYNDAETMSQVISYSTNLNLRIKTHSQNAVILWTGRQGSTEQGSHDYLSLGIENGFLHFRYDLGSGEVDIKYNATKVSDGLWHRIRAIRNAQDGFVEVDGRKSPTQRSPGKLKQLNTDTGLFVGGMPDVSYFTRRKYDSGIMGCISEIVLAGEVKLNFDPNTLGTSHNVETGIL